MDKGGSHGQNQHPSPQEKNTPPPLACKAHTPSFLSLGKFFHNGTVKSPWRLDFGHLVHHLWKFSPAASLQFTFLTAMHNENRYQYYGIGPIKLGKFDRSCLIWVYGFQLYLLFQLAFILCHLVFIYGDWFYLKLLQSFLKNYSAFKKKLVLNR